MGRAVHTSVNGQQKARGHLNVFVASSALEGSNPGLVLTFRCVSPNPVFSFISNVSRFQELPCYPGEFPNCSLSLPSLKEALIGIALKINGGTRAFSTQPTSLGEK